MGTLPVFLGSMTSLRKLALDGNQFGGSVPPELGMLTDLRRLYLEKNELVSWWRAPILYQCSTRSDGREMVSTGAVEPHE